jgi:hypothetical protein
MEAVDFSIPWKMINRPVKEWHSSNCVDQPQKSELSLYINGMESIDCSNMKGYSYGSPNPITNNGMWSPVCNQ